MIDSIKDFNLTIESGKIYGLVGSLGTGGWLLSHLLSGRDPQFFNNLELVDSHITIDGLPANNKLLKSISCYIGEGVAEIPYKKYNSYPSKLTLKLRKIKTVAEQILEGITRSTNMLSLQEIANLFELTDINESGRIYRPLEFNSGERWRASLAIGFAFQKKLFCAPWIEPHGIDYILSEQNIKYLKILQEAGAAIILPVSSERYVAGIADEIVHLKETFISSTQS
jgi:ABC-type glutathione transport system ATPase component